MSAANVRTVELADGRRVCLSYGVPVAAFVPGTGYVKTDRKHSVTTSRHANAFCGGQGNVISQAAFEQMILPVVGGGL